MTEQRALLLMNQGRHAMAADELRLALVDAPEDPVLHALLALCLAAAHRLDEAETAARHAVHLGPDLAFAHYTLARVQAERKRWVPAEKAARTAISLDPEQPDFRAMLAGIHLDRGRWAAALEEADRGLALDAQHVACANLRATALVNLGRRDEAALTLGEALARDPEDPDTHANQGWALLHRGEPRRALEHFREALRLDPSSDWARAGLVEAMKARNPVYGAVLRYFLWMSRLPPRTQWLVIVGGLIGYHLLRGITQTTPGLAPFATPVFVAYIGFVLLTWTADRLFDLVLFLDPVGRMALTREERLGAMAMGALFFPALAFGVTALATGSAAALAAALVCGGLMIPLAATLRAGPGSTRLSMAALTGLLAAIGATAVALGPMGMGAPETASTLFTVVLVGIAAFSWFGNAVAMRR
jgi:tetratricopeptide (TPR) repeat protein